MRKNKLIELLQAIEGNPDMFVYNGLVDDIQPIKNMKDVLITDKLYKPSYDYILTGLKMDWCNYHHTYDIPSTVLEELECKAKLQHKHIEWEEHNPHYGTSDIYSRSKNICIIQPSAAGKSTFDRLGSTDY